MITMKLKEIGKITTGKTPSKNIKNAFGNYISFLTPKDFNGQRYSNITERSLSIEGVENVYNYIVKGPSVSVTCIGSDMGKTIFNEKDIISNQQINSISEIDSNINPMYLYYLLYTKRKQLHFIGSAQGSTMPILNKSDFGNLEFSFPSRKEQDIIVAKINSFDSKIEINNKINTNLLAIAKEKYQKMLASSLLTKTKLKDFATITMGQSPSSKTYNKEKQGVALLNGATDFRNGIHPSKWTTDPKKVVNKGAYIFGVRATIGLTTKVFNKYAIGRGTGSAVSKDTTNDEFLYFVLNDMFKDFKNTGSGSVYINISKKDLNEYTFYKPKINELISFHQTIAPIMNKIYTNNQENIVLTEIKENLLKQFF